jgi:Protein of unknown function (DUF1091)
MRRGKSTWKPTNIDMSFDFCAFADGLKVPFIDVFAPGIGQVLKTSRFSCPFLGGFHIQNYTASPHNFPTNIAVGTQLKTDVIMSNDRSMPFLSCYLYGKVYSE